MTEHAAAGMLELAFRHRATELVTTNGAVTGVRGDILENSTAARGHSTSRTISETFEYEAEAVVLTTGGIGGNHAIVRKHWPKDRLGKPPKKMVAGVPDYVDGKMHGIAKKAEAFKNKGADFVVADDLGALVAGMNKITPDQPLGLEGIRSQIEARDAQLTNPFGKDANAIRGARAYRGDKLVRTAKPHAILDTANGPLIAVRLNILTRKSLGGLHTDIKGQVLTPEGTVLPGLYAAGEVCGFGGGGYHGYNALEGTFLGGCLFSGRLAGQNA
ncbi:KsdD-like steroid dehydrogenase [Nymphon striatum]|nr:KsdD-like steroid dehydrogenase [Nymphon striatum]